MGPSRARWRLPLFGELCAAASHCTDRKDADRTEIDRSKVGNAIGAIPGGRRQRFAQGSEAFVAAFNKHDAKGVAALWTEDGEYIDDSGRVITGRDAIEQDYAAFFTENPNVEIKMVIDSLRVISGDVAIEQGRAVVQPPPPGAPGVSSYFAVHAKVDSKWLMASVRDTWIETRTTPESIADIGWLIGTWTAEEHGVKNESVCRPVAGGHFIERTYTTTLLDGSQVSGLQLIGWNPLEGRLQSWSFSPDGGHDIGVWSPVNDGWQIRDAWRDTVRGHPHRRST